MDTSSLAVIVGHWKRLEAVGGTLVLAGARYRYTKTLWITGLADRLSLYGSVDEAVAAGHPVGSQAGDSQAGPPEPVPPTDPSAAVPPTGAMGGGPSGQPPACPTAPSR